MTSTVSDDKLDKTCRKSVPIVEASTSGNTIERKLAKLFKCCFYRDKCFFTTDDPASFHGHLEVKHSGQNFTCIYCYYQSGETEPYEKTDRLIEHILYNHGYRNFQCNSCVYRGSSVSHVLLHQANIHGIKYQETLSGDDSVGKCKVLVCQQIIAGPLPSESVYWSNCRVDKIETRDDAPKYQCLYCDFASFIPHVVFFHICKVHPDYSLALFDKYVDPLPEIEEAEENREGLSTDDDADIEAFIHDVHAAKIRDDDVDMAPVDDGPMSDVSDSENVDCNSEARVGPGTPVEAPRERLFALKGVRISRKQSDKNDKTNKAGKARKSTAKPTPLPEPDYDKDDDEEEFDQPVYRKPRGFKPEQENVINSLMPLGTKTHGRNMFKCLICDIFLKNQPDVDSHLAREHNSQSSFKCKKCVFIGSKNEVGHHFRSAHSHIEEGFSNYWFKFIVAADSTEQNLVPNGGQPVRLGNGGSSSTPMNRKKAEKDPKNLSTKIKKSTFIGMKNWGQKRSGQKSTDGNVPDDHSDVEELGADDIMEVEDVENNVNLEPNRVAQTSDHGARQVKRKRCEIERETNEPEEPEKLIEVASPAERLSEYFFCLFCDYNSKDFEEAQAHMGRHLNLDKMVCPKCPTFQCSTSQEFREHCGQEHIFETIKAPNYNAQLNYITRFFNSQFTSSRKGDKMDSIQATRYDRIICPICERAHQLTGDSSYHFTKWRSFKIHFWKHAAASSIECLRCDAYVPRTKKRYHLRDIHYREVDDDIFEIKDFSPHYKDPLAGRVLSFLKNQKFQRKSDYEDRIRLQYDIVDCRIVLDETLKKAIDLFTNKIPIKQEPKDK